MMTLRCRLSQQKILVAAAVLLGSAVPVLPETSKNSDADPAYPPQGRFYQVHHLRLGVEHGNPQYRKEDSWFRVNSPGVSLMKDIKHRHETRYNGLMMIRADADITLLAGAELYLEVWGGHPGTFNKRVSVNGRSTYALPEVGSASNHCTHSYPVIPLKPSDLVNGYNAFQFACNKDGDWPWGHFIVHDAELRLELPADHPVLKESKLNGFEARVRAEPAPDWRDAILLSLNAPAAMMPRVAAVAYQAFCEGYDENGNGLNRDWHGLTHRRRPVAFAAESTQPPFHCQWDTSMVSEQEGMAVRAILTFKDADDLVHLTPPCGGIRTPRRPHHRVELHAPARIPVPFWSRAFHD